MPDYVLTSLYSGAETGNVVGSTPIVSETNRK